MPVGGTGQAGSRCVLTLTPTLTLTLTLKLTLTLLFLPLTAHSAAKKHPQATGTPPPPLAGTMKCHLINCI